MKKDFWKQQANVLALITSAAVIICLIILFFFKPEYFHNIWNAFVALMSPFLWGFFIAYLLRPMAIRIEAFIRKLSSRIRKRFKMKDKKGEPFWPRLTAAFIAVIIMLLAVILILLIVLPQLITSISSIVSSLPDSVERFQTWIGNLGKGDTSSSLAKYISDSVATITSSIEQYLESSMLPALQSAIPDVTSSFMSIIGVLGNFGLGLIISIYFLCGWERFIAQGKLLLYSIIPKKGSDWIWNELSYADHLFSGFIIGKIVDSIIVGVLCFIFSALFRFPYAALISVLIGVFNMIPFFGQYLGPIPAFLLILTVSPVKAIEFLIFIIILEQLDGNVIGPKIIGDRLGISSFWILFSILFFGSLWGLIGMLIGAPLFALLYDLIRRSIFSGLSRKGLDSMKQEYSDTFGEDKP